MTIIRTGTKFQLVSKKKDAKGKRKSLGKFDTRAAALKRERQVNFFKKRGK